MLSYHSQSLFPHADGLFLVLMGCQSGNDHPFRLRLHVHLHLDPVCRANVRKGRVVEQDRVMVELNLIATQAMTRQ